MQVVEATKFALGSYAEQIERTLDKDLMSITGPIRFGLDNSVRDAAELFDSKRSGVAVVVHTGGGIVEVVERIVQVLRHHWRDVTFIVPDYALSAGTVLVLSGDAIMMDYFSSLGPIDPQLQRADGRLVPALSYLTQYARIMEKFRRGEGTTADLALLNQLDLAELHQFEEARKLSVELLRQWLATYKFKDWVTTEGQGTPVTAAMREARAEEIAQMLSDHERWHSHGRGISMGVLQRELNLRIDDFSKTPGLADALRSYHRLLLDLVGREGIASFVHTRYYF